MNLLSKFLERYEFSSYEDFKANFHLNTPEDFDFARDVVDYYAAEDPEKKALVWISDSGEKRVFTFADISLLSKKAASVLVNHGIRAGDKVILLLRRRWEYWVTAVALHRIGAVLIPASIQLTTKDIVYRANIASVKMIIALNDDFVYSQVTSALPSCPSVENVLLVNGSRGGLENLSSSIEEAEPLEGYSGLPVSDTMIMYFTSGTTGMPKAVIHDRRYPIGHIVTAKYMQNVRDGGLHLTVSDSGWAKFGWGCLYGQWICGSAIVGHDPIKFSPEELIKLIRTERPTTLCVPPTIYRFMIRAGITREDFASVEHCATAGEPLSPAVSEEFRSITGLSIHEGFGQSEGPVLVCTWPWVKPHFGSMGKPSPAYDIKIVDNDGNECGVGENGEIVLKGLGELPPPGLMRALLADGVQARNYDDVYHTKDIAYADEDGYFWYVGRNDDVIKCSGYRIGPYEIESVLNTHEAVHECAISGAPDPIRGQIVCASVVLNAGYEPSEEMTRELQQYVKKLTAPYKYPRVIKYVDNIPKTPSGKIIRARH